ncbi:MAG: replicative DNA helicase [Fimbriimonadaceae bacterium]|nr:replicative DNA helicase [Fimbriimonadaceae bacterium]
MRNPEAGVPLHDLEAEMSVLGSMLLSERATEEIVTMLKDEHFYRPAHREIFRAMRQLVQDSKAIDLLTLRNELQQRQKLSEVGGVDYLYQIAEMVPSAANAIHYANIVLDMATLRALEDAGRDIVGLARGDEGSVKEKVDRAEQQVFLVSSDRLGKYFESVRDLAKDYFVDIDRLYETGVPQLGTQTDFPDLDRVTTGLYPGNLIIIAARPAMGKTSFVLSLAVNIAKLKQGNVAFFSLEMSDKELVRRMIAMESGIPAQALKRPELSHRDYEKLVDGAERLYDLPIYIDDSSDVKPLELKAKCRRLKANGGLALVVVDYLQLMKTDRRNDNRVQEISEIARMLKATSKDLEVPVIALSQLNRGVESRENKRPLLSDIRESGSIEAEADIVMMLYRDSYYANKDRDFHDDLDPLTAEAAEVIIAKHRNGPVGTVVLGFRPGVAQWVSLRREDVDAYWKSIRNRDSD